MSSSDDATPERVGVIVSAEGGMVIGILSTASGWGDVARMGEDGGERVGFAGSVGIDIPVELEWDAVRPKAVRDPAAWSLRYRANGFGATGAGAGGAPLNATGGGLFAYASKPDTTRGAGVVRVSMEGMALGRLDEAGDTEYSVCECGCNSG